MNFNKKELLKIGFVIVSSEPNIGRLRATNNSIKNNLSCSNLICVVPKSTTKESIKELETVCSVFKAKGNTFISLLNSGFKNGVEDWNITIVEGAYVRKSIEKKYTFFTDNEKDILFNVDRERDIQGKSTKLYEDFWTCSINGIMINKKTFKEVGDFAESNSMEVSRLLWAAHATELDCKFKGIVGAKMI